MNKTLAIMLACCCSLAATAQQVTVTRDTRLPVSQAAYYPVLDAAGTRLLYSDGDARGLSMLDLSTSSITQITAEPGAGIDARFGADGNIYYVSQEVREGNLVYRSGYRYDTALRRATRVLEPQHGAVTTSLGTDAVAIDGPRRSYASAGDMGTAVRAHGSTLLITSAGTTRSVSPVESYAGYLWPVLSPGGDKVAFVAAGKGLVVTDLQGRVLAMLGRQYEMPSWYDNDYLVAQVATDDGHQFTASHIELVKADGTFAAPLTASTSMTMQPAAAGGNIVCTTIDGQLHLLNIVINQ